MYRVCDSLYLSIYPFSSIFFSVGKAPVQDLSLTLECPHHHHHHIYHHHHIGVNLSRLESVTKSMKKWDMVINKWGKYSFLGIKKWDCPS